jgi:hypothetical protein
MVRKIVSRAGRDLAKELKQSVSVKKKYLTLDEARAALPKVRKSVSRLMKLNSTLSLMGDIDVEFDDVFKDQAFDIAFSKRFFKLSHDFFAVLEELHGMSCMVSDVDLGLVEFYSLHDGREILLCYQLGEKDIMFWREVGDDSSKLFDVALLNDSLDFYHV